MCVLCAYVGNQPAAPIMLDMLEHQEGFWGGYYTGLATIDGSTLHHDKVVGDVAALRDQTKAAELPGTIGVAHSRTPSGGDREWGHPFIDCTGKIAYIAQGSNGAFKDTIDRDAVLAQLVADGHRIRSLCNEKVGSYPSLDDGRSAHASDMMCHAIEANLDACGDPVEAMRLSFEQLKSEIVGLFISADFPDTIFAATFNQSLWLGRDADGAYLSTAPSAMPPSAKWRSVVPANSVVAVSRDRMEVYNLFGLDETPADGISRAAVERSVLEQLAEKPGKRPSELYGAMKELCPPGPSLLPRTLYEVLGQLLAAGTIRFEVARVPGMFGQGTAPQAKFHLNEA